MGHYHHLSHRNQANPDSLPLSATDVLRQPVFLSDDPSSRDYVRLDPKHFPLDGEHFGAFPPGPAPAEGDWFTRLQKRWKAALDE